ncbi:MAG: GAF domain-containing protein [Candidatus Zixiibacteriota bacterium]
MNKPHTAHLEALTGPSPSLPSSSERITGRILIVDDEPRMTSSVCELLAREGHQAVGAQSAREAIALLDIEPFDVVLADVRMPGGGGLDVLRAARAADPERPVILFTAYASVESAVAAINEGAYDYLIKPIDPHELHLTVSRAVKQRRLQLAGRRMLEELKESHRALSHRVAELNALHEVSAALSTTAELPRLLEAILRLATGVIGATHGSIMLADHKRGVLTVAAASGRAASEYLNISVPMGESIAGTVAVSGEPVLIENVETDPRFARCNRPQFETRSLVSAPLKTPNAIVGVICLADKRGTEAFSQEDLRLLTTLAAQAAMAIEDATHYQRVRRQLGEVMALHELSERLTGVERTDQMVMAVFACLEQLIPNQRLQWWQWESGQGNLRLGADTAHATFADPDGAPACAPDSGIWNDRDQLAQSLRHALSGTTFDAGTGALLAAPVRSAERPLGVFVILRSEQHAFEEAEKQLVRLVASQAERIFDRQRSLWNASRLVTMGKMISEISHDLRKPLTNIRGSLQVLRGRLPADNDTQTILTATEEEVVRLATLVTELVDFSNPKRYHTERRDVRPLLLRALALIDQTARKRGIEIITNIPPALRPIFCDENQLTEALLNVLMNAIEAMTDGGRLTFTVTAEPEFPDGDEQITVAITDTGTGMTPAEVARCFERYYTTKSSGTGLGLAIVERIIRAHDGRIVAESTPGVGTTFRLRLPVR